MLQHKKWQILLIVVLSATACVASGRVLQNSVVKKTKTASAAITVEGYVKDNGLYSSYSTKAPLVTPTKKVVALHKPSGIKSSDGDSKKVKIEYRTQSENKDGEYKGSLLVKATGTDAKAADAKNADKGAATAKAAKSTTTTVAKYTPAAAKKDPAYAIKDQSSGDKEIAHSGCESGDGGDCHSNQFKFVIDEKEKKVETGHPSVDIALKIKTAIFDDAEARAQSFALVRKGNFGALALSKAILLAIFGEASTQGYAIAIGLDADAKACSQAISKAIFKDAEAIGYARALSRDGRMAQAVSKSVAESIGGDVYANDYAVAVTEKGDETNPVNAKAKSEADSKTKKGYATSISGANSLATDGGRSTSDSKAKAKSKDSPAWSASNSIAATKTADNTRGSDSTGSAGSTASAQSEAKQGAQAMSSSLATLE